MHFSVPFLALATTALAALPAPVRINVLIDDLNKAGDVRTGTTFYAFNASASGIDGFGAYPNFNTFCSYFTSGPNKNSDYAACKNGDVQVLIDFSLSKPDGVLYVRDTPVHPDAIYFQGQHDLPSGLNGYTYQNFTMELYPIAASTPTAA